MIETDFLIVGAGIAGLVLAERLANEGGVRCVIVERRSHIGGNCYDYTDGYGVLVHKYGPHYFRTDSEPVRAYLSRFTAWRFVDYKIKVFSDGRYWSFPVNLNTFEELIGRSATTGEFEAWLASVRVPISQPRNSEEVIVSQVGWGLYRKFFLGYTLKQWGVCPRDLDASVCGRIPIRTNRDDRYLKESFQAIPANGYTVMFERLLASCRGNVRIFLDTDFRAVRNEVRCRHVIYTGAIDEYYDRRFGGLPYRSLRFEHESFDAAQLKARLSVSGKLGFWQPAMQVNYPNDNEFTRIVEIKHATGQQCVNSTIVREYPEGTAKGCEPYYPIPMLESSNAYRKYAELAESDGSISFLGRLGMYKYYNMDQVVALSLAAASRLLATVHVA